MIITASMTASDKQFIKTNLNNLLVGSMFVIIVLGVRIGFYLKYFYNFYLFLIVGIVLFGSLLLIFFNYFKLYFEVRNNQKMILKGILQNYYIKKGIVYLTVNNQYFSFKFGNELKLSANREIGIHYLPKSKIVLFLQLQ